MGEKELERIRVAIGGLLKAFGASAHDGVGKEVGRIESDVGHRFGSAIV